MLSSPEQKNDSEYESRNLNSNRLSKLIIRRIALFLLLIAVIGFWAYQVDITLPNPPNVSKTFTPITQPTAQQIGSYDVLGKIVSKDEAGSLLRTDAGKELLSEKNGAVEIDNDLIKLGRKSFYTETFGNEVFLTDVTGILNGPMNIGNLTKYLASFC